MEEIFTEGQWEDLLEQSNEVPVLLLKHSSTCPISAAAYGSFQRTETDLPKYYIIVQTSRPLSRQIERDTGIRHESPQLFLLKEGKVVWQATHHAILESAVEQAIGQYYK